MTPRYVLSHVYSNSNSGDALLARLSSELLQEALAEPIAVVALDSAGMDAFGTPVIFGGRARSKAGGARELAAALHLGSSAAMTSLREADLVVACGGGYLRATSARDAAVLSATHLPQLVAETSAPRRGVVFLPQSIGPLPSPLVRLVRARLANATAVMARDARSLALFRGAPNVRRVPDLGTLEVARVLPPEPPPRRPSRRALLQVRALKRVPELPAIVRSMLETADDEYEVVIQSVAGGSNDDRAFTSEATGCDSPRLLGDVLEAEASDVSYAVCGRLHAALSCVLAGVPSLHIAYERKSFAAYEDLGIRRYLVLPDEVGGPRFRELVTELRTHPALFWDSVRAALPQLRQERQRLVDVIQDAAAIANDRPDRLTAAR